MIEPQATCVLVMDDEPILAIELADVLTLHGVASVIARDFQQAFALLEKQEFGGAILDVSMLTPTASARLCKVLKESATPFVVYSGQPFEAADAVAIFSKPCNVNEMVQTLLSAMTMRPGFMSSRSQVTTHRGN